MNNLQRRIKGWYLIGESWPYSKNGGRWPLYRAGMILDSKTADIKRMQLLDWDFIHLPEGIKN